MDRLMTSWTFEKQGGISVNKEKGIIRNVAVVSVGTAKGHGVELDSEFIEETVRQGNEFRNGVKMRFGHPTMSSTALGTFLGRAKNFRVDNSGEVPIARADAFLSTEAKDTPNGNLFDYVLGMADNESDAFGLSIVFKPGDKFQFDDDGVKKKDNFDPAKPTFIENDKFNFVDFVDDPAANASGLFSTFDSTTIAGQVSEFLDTHPMIWDVMKDRPDIFETFTARYNEYLQRKDTTTTDGFDAETINEELSAVADTHSGSVEPDKQNEEPKMSDERKLFQEMEEKFGTEIASEVFKTGGTLEDAQAKFEEQKFTALQAECDELKSKNAELNTEVEELNAKLKAITDGEAPVDFEDAGEETVLNEPEAIDCNAKIKEYRDQGLSATEAQDKVLADYPEEFKKQFNVGA